MPRDTAPPPTSGSSGSPLAALAGKRVLVLGNSGFLGCHAAVLAARHHAQVTGIDLPGTAERGGKLRRAMGAAETESMLWTQAQLEADLGAWLLDRRPHIILLASGATSRGHLPADWLASVRGNVLPPAATLTAAAAMDDDARPVLILPASQMEYGQAPAPWTEQTPAQPLNAYGASKLMATELLCAAVRRGQVRGCALRLPLVFGPGQSPSMLVPEIIVKGLQGTPIAMSSGVQRRRFVDAEDAAGMMLAAGCRLAAGEPLPALVNAAASAPISIAEMARRTADCLPVTADLRIGSLPQRADERPDAWPDTTLAESLLLHPLRDVDVSLRRTVDWYRENRWFFSPA